MLPFLARLAALAFLLAAGAAHAAPLAGAERTAALAVANKALNAPGPLRGRFVQIGPDGKAADGSFYLQRPGKVRFEYDDPYPLRIVADGSIVSIEDRALKTVNRAPLKTTPLFLVLKRDVNLERDAKIKSVSSEGGAIAVTLRDKANESDGELSLIFDKASGQLRQWRVTDAAGNVTLTALQTIEHVAFLDPKLFATMAPKAGPRSQP